jgi:cysteine synthase
MIVESPLDLIFRDLFYRLRAFAGNHDVFLKLEGFNITGSIKIKTAIGLVEDLEERGIAKPAETVIVESSSGNLGLALSLVCAIKGYKFICVTDPNANRATIKGMELYGAEVIVVADRDPAGGFLGSRLKKIDQLLQSEANAVWLNQYANLANKNVHAEQTANEIAHEFDKVDWVFVGSGTTGTLAGISGRSRRAGRLSHVRRRAWETKHPRHWHERQTKACGPHQPGHGCNGERRKNGRYLSFFRSRLSLACGGKHRNSPGRRTTASPRVQAWRHHRRDIRGSWRKVLRQYL